MELLSVACLCLLTWSGVTSADERGPVVVTEGSDAVLQCSLSTKQNIEKELFDWKKDGQKEVFMYDAGVHYNNGREGQDEQFKGRVSHFNDELKNGNASIIIRNTKVADSGNYTCAFPHLQPRQTFHIRLVVGAATEPYVTILDETKDGVLLQCVVRGAFPKPTVEWKDSAGNIIPAKELQVSEREGGGGYDIILQATVTKSDRFSCVVTQEKIGHQTEAKIFLPLPPPAPNDSSTGSIVAAVLVTFFICLIVIGGLAVLCVRRRIR